MPLVRARIAQDARSARSARSGYGRPSAPLIGACKRYFATAIRMPAVALPAPINRARSHVSGSRRSVIETPGDLPAGGRPGLRLGSVMGDFDDGQFVLRACRHIGEQVGIVPVPGITSKGVDGSGLVRSAVLAHVSAVGGDLEGLRVHLCSPVVCVSDVILPLHNCAVNTANAQLFLLAHAGDRIAQ